MNTSLRIAVLTVLCIPFTLSAAVPTSPPTGGTPGGVFSLYFQNMVGSVPCPAGSIIKTYDTTPGTNYGKRQCVSLAAGAVKDAFSGFDSTTGAPVYMNAWVKSGTSVYYNTAGGNVGVGTSAPTEKLDVVGNIKASGNISTPASTVLTSGKIQVLDIVTENAACTPNGLIARDSVGVLLSCQSGTWKKASGGGGVKQLVSDVGNYAGSRTINTSHSNTWGAIIASGYYSIVGSVLYVSNTAPYTYSGPICSFSLATGNCTITYPGYQAMLGAPGATSRSIKFTPQHGGLLLTYTICSAYTYVGFGMSSCSGNSEVDKILGWIY